MPGDTPHINDIFSADEMVRIRGRIHNMADKVQGHEITQENHRVEINRLNEAVRELRQSSVNQSQFMGLVADILELRTNSATKTELTAAVSLHNLKLDAIAANQAAMEKAQDKVNAERKADQEKINGIFSKLAFFIIFAVLAAVLGLVIANKGAIGKGISSMKVIPGVVAKGAIE